MSTPSILTYFSLLPDEVLENVVRQCSECPRHPNWCTYFSPDQAVKLLAPNSQLQRVSSNLFSQLEVSNGSPRLENSLLLPYYGTNEVVEKCLLDFGSVLRKLAVYEKPQASRSRPWLMLASKYCVHLNTLLIFGQVDTSALTHLLATRGNQLHSLSLTVFRPWITFTAIGAWCPALRELELTGLREKSSDLWESIGSSLRKLRIVFSFRADIIPTLKEIAYNCRGLKSIDIPAPLGGFSGEVTDIMSELYASYGDQLEYINFREANLRDYRKVLASCKNFRCSAGFCFGLSRLGPWTVSDAEKLITQLDVLGSSVMELQIFGSPPQSFQIPSSIATDCNSIERIHGLKLGARSNELFSFLFSTPKRALKSFKWEPNWPILGDIAAQEYLLATLSNFTGSLEEFSLRLDATKLGVFDSFAAKNSNLTNVRIMIFSGSIFPVVQAESILVDIVKAFSVCRHLRELLITCDGGVWSSSEMKDRRKVLYESSFMLRSRGCFVRISDEIYSP